MRIRPTRAAAVGVLVLLALAACGEQAPQPGERLANASDATFAERTASFSMEMDMKMGESGSAMSFTTRGKGAVDLDAERGRMEMSLPGGDRAMSMVFDGDVMYMHLPFGGGEQPWIRQDASEMSQFGSNRTIGSRPSAWLDALDDVRGDIRSLGSDTVRGSDVQGYAFTTRAVDVWGEGVDSAMLDTLPASLKELQIPTRVWLDAEDRVRRMVMEIDMGKVMSAVQEMQADSADGQGGLGPMAGMKGTATLTVDFFDFGTNVDIQVPDSANVVTMEEFRRQQARQSGGAGLDTRVR